MRSVFAFMRQRADSVKLALGLPQTIIEVMDGFYPDAFVDIPPVRQHPHNC